MARLRCIYCDSRMDEVGKGEFYCDNCGSEASYLDDDEPTSDPEDYDWCEGDLDAEVDYDSAYGDDKPDCCRGCGGNYPDCMDSCKIFDD